MFYQLFIQYVQGFYIACMCQFLDNADNVLEQSLNCHQPNSNLSLRQQIFDEKLGEIA